MNLMNTDTVLARSTESRKFTTTDTIVSLASSDSGDIIVVGGRSKDGKGVIHCLGPGGELKWSQTYPKIVSSVNVAGRGSLVFMGGEGKATYMFTPFGQMAWTDDCRSDIKDLALSASGRFSVAGMTDGTLNVYDNDIVAARKFAWKHRFGKAVTEVSINADGTMVCASTVEGELAVFTERGDLVWSKVLENGIGSFRIAAEGDAIIVASNDDKLRLYSAEVGKNIWTVSGGGAFSDVDLTQKGDRAVAVCKDGFVYCFDKAGAVLWKYFMGNPGEKIKVSKNGKTIVASSIDAIVHCIDPKGNLIWKHHTGSSSVLGLVVSENGDMVVSSCENGLLYFDNIQVVGGLLPVIRHEITLAKEKGISTFKTEKIYEEAVVALNFGDYITAAGKIREIEKALGPVQRPAPSPDAVVAPAPAPAKPVSEGAQNARVKIDAILAETEALKAKGVNVEPVENLLGEAMVLLEDGNLDDSLAYIQDALEMLDGIRATIPPEPKPIAPVVNKVKEDAMKAVEKAATMLSELEDTDIHLEAVRGDILTARDLIQGADYQRAVTAANRAIVTMEKALDPYITNCLIAIQKLIKTAEKEGIKVEEPRKGLNKVRDQMRAADFIGALDTVTEVEEWIETALKNKPQATSPPLAPKPVEPVKPGPVAPGPPKAGGLDALKADVSPKLKKPDEPAKPIIDVNKILSKDDPQKAFAEAEDALKSGALPKAVEIYMRVAETVVERARIIVDETLAKASQQVAKVKKEGFDVTEAIGLIEGAKRDLGAADYIAAVMKAQTAVEKADNAAAAEIAKVIDESRKALEMAQKIGANIQIAEELINNAETAMKKREYKVAVEYADKGVAEVEKTSNATVLKILDEGKVFLEKALAMGADVTKVKSEFEEARKALQSRVFMKAHELAKKAVESSKEIPKKFVSDKLTDARNKVVTAEKMGSDTMMAKNYLIKARSSLAAGDYEGALRALDKSIEETDRAPRDLVNKRMALAKTDVEDVRAMGQSTSDAEAILGQAEGKVAELKFEEAIKLIETAHAKLREIKELGAQATNAIFDADMAISIARDVGKDVTKANEQMHQALEVRAKDPGKAKNLALEIKKMLEG